jgi:hypothetical protein
MVKSPLETKAWSARNAKVLDMRRKAVIGGFAQEMVSGGESPEIG